MSRRERILLTAAGVIALGFVFHVMLNRLLLGPSGAYDHRIQDTVRQITRIKAVNKQRHVYEQKLAELAGRTFGADEWAVSEQIRNRLVNLVTHSGLSRGDFSVRSATITNRTALKGKEISRRISAGGKLEYVIDFLYLLSADPHLHRLEDVTLTPKLREGQTELSLRYATLVLPDVEAALASSRPAELSAQDDLDSAQREQYQLIASRDMFRPYVQKKVPKKPARPKRTRPDKPQPPKPPPLSRFKIIALPSWGKVQDVRVANTDSGETKLYAVGDSLAGGKIVMVDYRPVPMFDDPEIVSGSRAIIQIADEYWAVELGRKLSEKRKLTGEELPSQLQRRINETPRIDAQAPPEKKGD